MIRGPSLGRLAVLRQGPGNVTGSGCQPAMLPAEAAISTQPYLSTCWMVQRLTSRSLASSRWLTPFDRSTWMYSRCCSVRLGLRPGKRPSARAFAWPTTDWFQIA